MLRIHREGEGLAPRLVEARVFVQEIDAYARGTDRWPRGGLRIEALDEHGRVRWTGYYSSSERLRELGRELQKELMLAGSESACR